MNKPSYDFKNTERVSDKEFPKEPNPELAEIEDSYTFSLTHTMYVMDGYIIRVSEYIKYNRHDSKGQGKNVQNIIKQSNWGCAGESK